MQLTETRRESQAGYANPLATKLSIFEAQNEYYSNQQLLPDESFVMSLCLCVFTGKANAVCAIKKGF
jgi:hypothetical protein